MSGGRAGDLRREMTASLRSNWDSAAGYQRFLYSLAAVFFVSGVVHSAVFLVDGGAWEGPVSWRKPISFAFSFSLVAAAFSWVATWLPRRSVAGWLLFGSFWVVRSSECGGDVPHHNAALARDRVELQLELLVRRTGVCGDGRTDRDHRGRHRGSHGLESQVSPNQPQLRMGRQRRTPPHGRRPGYRRGHHPGGKPPRRPRRPDFPRDVRAGGGHERSPRPRPSCSPGAPGARVAVSFTPSDESRRVRLVAAASVGYSGLVAVGGLQALAGRAPGDLGVVAVLLFWPSVALLLGALVAAG
jgi:hypothetical protein